MQKTFTVSGTRYTGKMIAKMFDPDNMTHGGDYIVFIEGWRMYGNYRWEQDAYFAPVCSKENATCIALYCPELGHVGYDLWLEL